MLKALITNPVLLGLQGFTAGALLIWASPAPAEASRLPAPVAAEQVQTVR